MKYMKMLMTKLFWILIIVIFFEDINNVSSASVNEYTASSSGCQCYFDSARFDCACCSAGGCQCHYSARNKCVQCGNGAACDLIDYKNCHSGSVTDSGSHFTMVVGTNPPSWPGAGMCHLIWLETKAAVYNYTAEFYPGIHPGIMFNWQDKDNYDFIYIRAHHSSCIVRGSNIAGSISTAVQSASCGAFGNGKWNKMTVAVTPTTVQIYANGVAQFSSWTPKFGPGYLGGATANGYVDTIKYRNFWLSEDAGVIYIDEGCKFKRIKVKADGVHSNCGNPTSSTAFSSSESCIAAACAAGTTKNAVNIDLGTSCSLRECATPMQIEANVLLTAGSSRDVWVRDFDDCSTAPCKNGGNCTDGTYTYSCTCTDTGFTGPTCEINIDDCSPNPCKNGGVCSDLIKDFNCTCAAGYTDKTCNTNIDDCAGNPCLNGATCNDGINSYTCTCVVGYTGANCETDINDCSPNPCQNGGTCTDGVNSYSCACAAGYTGSTCSVNINECSPNPCLNGGTCTDGVNSFTCNCATGYTGNTCETDIDDCSPNPCQNSGTCQDGVNSYTCSCVAGYTDSTCNTNIDECAGSPCKNTGQCTDGVNAYTCDCSGTGYKGSDCTTAISSCADTPCINGATCSDNSGIQCSCATGYTGQYCKTYSGACASNPCQNGAACQFSGNQYTCTCVNGYTGTNCQTAPPCNSSPCANGATCANNGAQYSCTCASGYTGATCESEVSSNSHSSIQHQSGSNNNENSAGNTATIAAGASTGLLALAAAGTVLGVWLKKRNKTDSGSEENKDPESEGDDAATRNGMAPRATTMANKSASNNMPEVSA